MSWRHSSRIPHILTDWLDYAEKKFYNTETRSAGYFSTPSRPPASSCPRPRSAPRRHGTNAIKLSRVVIYHCSNKIIDNIDSTSFPSQLTNGPNKLDCYITLADICYDLRSIINICFYKNILYSTFNQSACASLLIRLCLSLFY